MAKKETITVKDSEIVIFKKEQEDYISLTDIAKVRDNENPSQIISLWMRTYSTIEYLGLWEMLNNPNFNPHIYEGFKNESAKPHFWMSAQKWITETNAIGITSKSGRYGEGTFAHSDIAFEFATWLSPEFKFLLIKEFKRLKSEESQQKSLEWNLQRTLSKINYRIHTDAIKDEIIPNEVTKEQAKSIYADEADLLNVALFGKTVVTGKPRQGRQYPRLYHFGTTCGAVEYGNVVQAECKPNLFEFVKAQPTFSKETYNALLIRQGLSQGERLTQLNYGDYANAVAGGEQKL